MSATTPATLIGMQIAKMFGNQGQFHGRVVSFKDPFYKVQYEDGDEEELTLEEVRALECERRPLRYAPALNAIRDRRHPSGGRRPLRIMPHVRWTGQRTHPVPKAVPL